MNFDIIIYITSFNVILETLTYILVVRGRKLRLRVELRTLQMTLVQ